MIVLTVRQKGQAVRDTAGGGKNIPLHLKKEHFTWGVIVTLFLAGRGTDLDHDSLLFPSSLGVSPPEGCLPNNMASEKSSVYSRLFVVASKSFLFKQMVVRGSSIFGKSCGCNVPV